MKVHVLAVMSGLCTSCLAQSTSLLSLSVSQDGVHWSQDLTLSGVNPVVQVRATMTFQRGGGTLVPVGFASLTWQPIVSNWNPPSDWLLTFADHGNNSNGGSVRDIPGTSPEYGRMLPFAATGPTTSDPYRGHTQAWSGVNYLRIARTSITNWLGEGPTSGTAGSNNFNGSGGIACVQKSMGNVGPTDPPFNSTISGVLLFKFGMVIDTSNIRTLTVDAPIDGMSRNSVTGAREASWFTDSSDNFGGLKTAVSTQAAVIRVLPAPTTGAILGLAAAWGVRRRR